MPISQVLREHFSEKAIFPFLPCFTPFIGAKKGYDNLTRISHEEHQTEWKNNTILINYTLI
jgi:hypothetical protein